MDGLFRSPAIWASCPFHKNAGHASILTDRLGRSRQCPRFQAIRPSTSFAIATGLHRSADPRPATWWQSEEFARRSCVTVSVMCEVSDLTHVIPPLFVLLDRICGSFVPADDLCGSHRPAGVAAAPVPVICSASARSCVISNTCIPARVSRLRSSSLLGLTAIPACVTSTSMSGPGVEMRRGRGRWGSRPRNKAPMIESWPPRQYRCVRRSRP